jgi:RNA polymerase sigma-70 factor (ECF subfamily)
MEQRVVGLAHDDLVEVPTDAYRAELDELLDLLDDERRAAFVLTQLTGLRYEEAAEVLGVPVGTIRSRVSRARQQLVAAVESPDSDSDRVEPDDDLRRPHTG